MQDKYFVAGLCVSLFLSVVLFGFNLNDVIHVFHLNQPRWLPNNWNMFFNYSYFLCFYMWLGCTIYIQARNKARLDPSCATQANGKDGNNTGTTQPRCWNQIKVQWLIIGSFVVFILSWIMNLVTGWLVIDYHPADYLTD